MSGPGLHNVIYSRIHNLIKKVRSPPATFESGKKYELRFQKSNIDAWNGVPFFFQIQAWFFCLNTELG